MTDTTDQQAVTVAQEDPVVVALREINEMAAGVGDIFPNDATAVVAIGQTASSALDALDARLASVSSASAETSVREAFSGVMRGEVVNGGAWSLHLHFGRGDGARDRMRAASSLLGSIVAAPPTPSATTSQEGEWVTVPREPTQDQLIAGNGMFHTGEVPLNIYRAMLAASPEPVPAANQAGEVEGAIRIAVWNACRDRGMGQDNTTMLVREVLAQPILSAALATQPATSQEEVR